MTWVKNSAGVKIADQQIARFRCKAAITGSGQATLLSESLIGFGYLPSLTP
jgi:hypothetical protein